MVDFQQKKIDRFRFLKACYEKVEGRRVTFIEHWVVGDSLGFDKEYTKEILQYLVDEGMLKFQSLGYSMLTQVGFNEVESSLSN
jgi:hypothetical protein